MQKIRFELSFSVENSKSVILNGMITCSVCVSAQTANDNIIVDIRRIKSLFMLNIVSIMSIIFMCTSGNSRECSVAQMTGGLNAVPLGGEEARFDS